MQIILCIKWWIKEHIGTLQRCYWCNRLFLADKKHALWTETGVDILCSEECLDKYARTL